MATAPSSSAPSPLPYVDTKPQGARGFYFTIGATARFIKERLGYDKLVQYWQDLGRGYYRPVSDRWRAGGLPAVATYWRAFFDAEPGGRVTIESLPDRVVVHVECCPLIHHLRENQREIIPEFCRHCHYVSDAIGLSAGIAARVCGGNGACRQEFLPRASASPQDLAAITLCS